MKEREKKMGLKKNLIFSPHETRTSQGGSVKWEGGSVKWEGGSVKCEV
jgi:hypothetical protein